MIVSAIDFGNVDVERDRPAGKFSAGKFDFGFALGVVILSLFSLAYGRYQQLKWDVPAGNV